MFRTLIYPSSGACDCVVELTHRSHCSQIVVCWRFGVTSFGWCSFCRLKLQPAFIFYFTSCVSAYKTSTTKEISPNFTKSDDSRGKINTPPFVHNLSYNNPVYAIAFCLFIIHFNIITVYCIRPGFLSGPFLLRFPTKNLYN
jgi:hypothetical protein